MDVVLGRDVPELLGEAQGLGGQPGKLAAGEKGGEILPLTGEVRRSFAGTYSPLYQVAYMMGGLQLRALYNEMVESKKMTAKAFHDTILREGSMPVEMLRAAMTDVPLSRAYRSRWKYYGDVTGGH